MDSREIILVTYTSVLERRLGSHALTRGSALAGERREREAEEKVRG